jgi:hypothetical protein
MNAADSVPMWHACVSCAAIFSAEIPTMFPVRFPDWRWLTGRSRILACADFNGAVGGFASTSRACQGTETGRAKPVAVSYNQEA